MRKFICLILMILCCSFMFIGCDDIYHDDPVKKIEKSEYKEDLFVDENDEIVSDKEEAVKNTEAKLTNTGAVEIVQNKFKDITIESVSYEADDNIYEIDAVDNKYEYDIEVNASTAEIIKVEKELLIM